MLCVCKSGFSTTVFEPKKAERVEVKPHFVERNFRNGIENDRRSLQGCRCWRLQSRLEAAEAGCQRADLLGHGPQPARFGGRCRERKLRHRLGEAIEGREKTSTSLGLSLNLGLQLPPSPKKTKIKTPTLNFRPRPSSRTAPPPPPRPSPAPSSAGRQKSRGRCCPPAQTRERASRGRGGRRCTGPRSRATPSSAGRCCGPGPTQGPRT